jgi:ribonuclease T2
LKKNRRISLTAAALAAFLLIFIAAMVFYGFLHLDTGSTTSPTPKLSVTYNNSAKFDYFILTLSWAPDYCATSGSGDFQECAAGKRLGFVLHGLWPQYRTGYPSNCSIDKLPEAVKARYAGLFPTDSLMVYEWEKHGTCSGLAPDPYLALAQQLKESVVVPEAFNAPQIPFRVTASQVRQAFSVVNPFLSEASIEMNCSELGDYLQEVYVCFGRDSNPAACGADVHKDTQKSCPASDFLVRNVQ